MRTAARLNQLLNLLLVFSLLATIYPAQALAAHIGLFEPATTSTLNAPTATEPTVIDSAITLTRAQSSFSAGGQVVVTYTVQSNLEPLSKPTVSPGGLR